MEPSNELFTFGEWVVKQCLRLLSKSYIRLVPPVTVINSIYKDYTNNQNMPIQLPNCHPVARFIIERLTKRIYSAYCRRLSSQLQGY